MRTQSRGTPRCQGIGAEARRLAQSAQEQIARAGESLTVTTPGRFGVPAVVRTVAFVPQPISPSTLTRLQYETVINIVSGMTMDFVCAGDVSIVIGDLIGPYEGATWLTLGTQPEMMGGVVLTRHVIAQRQ